MKAFFAIITIVLAVANSSYAQDINYVVIGAFSNRDNASRLAEKEKAEVDINPAKQLYYVFVSKTGDHAQALTEAVRIQKETTHRDAWVFVGVLGTKGRGVDVKPITEPPPQEQEPAPEKLTEPEKSPGPVVQTKKPSATDPKNFYFKVTTEDGTRLDGAEVTIVEPKSQRKELVFKGNENITVKPINQSGLMRLECDLAGYRKIVQVINFKSPDSLEGVRIENDRVVVPFYLVRLKKGDFSILYNVFFYKDAAIMRPESKFDLDGLLSMMNENSRYKIRIHGHTNGSASGPIMEAKDPANPFSMTGAKEGGGSAKKLSEKRAEVIRNYLVQNGVEPGRMDVKAWGGKKPIYDKHHTQASVNVRVEVEVLEE